VLLSALLAAVGAPPPPWKPRNAPAAPDGLSAAASAISEVDDGRGRACTVDGEALPKLGGGGGGLRPGCSGGGGSRPGGGRWRWRAISSGSKDAAFIVAMATERMLGGKKAKNGDNDNSTNGAVTANLFSEH